MSVMGELNKKRTVKTSTVPVLMDQEASTERERLEKVLIEAHNAAKPDDAGEARLGRSKADPNKDPMVQKANEALNEHNAKMAESILYIRFSQLPNSRWKQLQSGFPQRRNNKVDENFGYDIEAVLNKVLEEYVHVSTDPELPAAEWSSPDKAEVKEFMANLPSGEFNALFWAMHNLNEAKVSTDGLKKG